MRPRLLNLAKAGAPTDLDEAAEVRQFAQVVAQLAAPGGTAAEVATGLLELEQSQWALVLSVTAAAKKAIAPKNTGQLFPASTSAGRRAPFSFFWREHPLGYHQINGDLGG